MSRIVGPYDPNVGPVISVIVSDPVSDRPDHETPKTEKVTMLIDSGATDSAISGAVASRLSLPILGFHGVVGFGSRGTVYQYLADIDLCLDAIYSLSGQLLLEFSSDYGQIQGVIGRDIIGLGYLAIDGRKKEFTFEIG